MNSDRTEGHAVVTSATMRMLTLCLVVIARHQQDEEHPTTAGMS
jgi:hypothetical protein